MGILHFLLSDAQPLFNLSPNSRKKHANILGAGVCCFCKTLSSSQLIEAHKVKETINCIENTSVFIVDVTRTVFLTLIGESLINFDLFYCVLLAKSKNKKNNRQVCMSFKIRQFIHIECNFLCLYVRVGIVMALTFENLSKLLLCVCMWDIQIK